MRDHTKLRAFRLADDLTLLVYQVARTFPREEMFGPTAQMRRAAVSIASNIVEGSARRSQADYLRFSDIAFGSSRELQYRISLAERLGFIEDDTELAKACETTSKTVGALMKSLRAR